MTALAPPLLHTKRASLVLRGVGLTVISDEDEDPLVLLISELLTREPTWLSALRRGVSEEMALCAVQWLVAHNIQPVNSAWSVGNCLFKYTPMDRAAKRGFLSVVQYLYQHAAVGCTDYAVEHAAEYGHTDVLRFLCEHGCKGNLHEAMDMAIAKGYSDMARYLHETAVHPLTMRHWTAAATSGHRETFQYIHTHLPPAALMEDDIPLVETMSSAVQLRLLHVVEWLHEHIPAARGCSASAFQRAVMFKGHDVVQFILEQQYALDYVKAMDEAAGLDDLEMVKLFDEKSPVGCTTKALDNAAASGHLGIVRFLSEQRSEGCTTAAMDDAATDGLLAVVQYLHEYRTEGCTTAAMDGAAQNGYLDVVQFLNEHRTEGCTTDAMDKAAKHGHFDVVRYLTENRSEGCTTNAMDDAAAEGHLDIVRYLHDHSSIGCTTNAMDKAASSGHVAVLTFVHEHRTEGCTAAALAGAALNGRLDVARFLCESCACHHSLDRAVVDACITNQWLALLRYLHARGLVHLGHEAFLSTIAYGHVEMINYLYEQSVATLVEEHRTPIMGDAMDKAAGAGLMPVIVLLNSKRLEGETYSTGAIRVASLHWRLDIAEYLLRHGHQGSTVEFMDLAASRGRLDLVEFLHETRSDGCTSNAMDWAARGGHLNVVCFLHENRSEGCTYKALATAAASGYLAVVEFLNANRSEGCIQHALRGADPDIAEAMAALRCRCDYCVHGGLAPWATNIVPTWARTDFDY